jgi:hypothetical protein
MGASLVAGSKDPAYNLVAGSKDPAYDLAYLSPV